MTHEPPTPEITSDNLLRCPECGDVFGPYQRADQAQGEYEWHWRAKHVPAAPGPWRVDPGHIDGLLAIRDANGEAFAEVCGTRKVDYGSARLIAAAPAMLDALREMVMAINYEHDGQLNDLYGVSKALAAIAAATGTAVPGA